MKKNILKFGIALAVVVAAGYITYSSQTEIQLSGVTLDNVEAIASGENGNPPCANILAPCEPGLEGPYMMYK